jgi:2-keto-4-pentenoate hydratase/2-oxohepta-3-ene-1,7-dioic acid hydratase in catechol pathway
MKLVTFQQGEIARCGLVSGQSVHDLSSAGYGSALGFVEGGEAALARAEALLTEGGGTLFPLDDVTLLAPIPRPPRVFGVGLNYAEHAAESKMETQAVPTIFMKLSSSVIGTGADVVLPRNSKKPDYEAELGVVIGRPGYRIAADEAMDHVFGYTIVNDISARDVQRATTQFTLGKSFPTFTPIGPWIVTKDEIADPHALNIKLTIGDETLQDSNTRHMIFRIPQIIEYISSITPLEAGDVISTGTPHGVGMGRDPQRWIKPGETIRIQVQGVGELVNHTRAEE